jgi:nitric oxide reductase large subunit
MATPAGISWRWLVVRGSERRELLISKGWVQAVALVVLFGFFVLGLLAYRAYSGQPPIPDRVVDPRGEVVFTGEDVRAGQGVFLRNGLMQYGSIFGHGAYLGPDFTADYLRRSALFVRESYGGEGSDRAAVQTVSDFKENRYDPETRTLEFTAPQAATFEELEEHYGRYFGEPTTKYGLRPEAIKDPEDIRQLTAYFAWTAWAASALRPGTDYTYTNNWPPEPLVENEPTANVLTGDLWAWFGNQGFEYLDLGRFWQVLLSIGLFFWVAMLFRAMRGRLRREHAGNMPWLFFFAALAIPAFYAVGLLARPESHFTTADFWRFWVVHLWVEDFLELFTTVMVAYIFVLLGVVREKVALTVIYLDILLYSAGGVIGTMHHLYFSGTPAEHMALGAFFSAAEVIPLTFLTVEAWSFLQLGARQESRSRTPFPHRWAVMFLVAVGFWNFLGAGIFGFLINLPIISYYQIGTALTSNHGHAAMMGVYGMLAAGLALFCLRYLIPEERWSERAAKISFWSLNIGLAWMCFATLFPLGILQLYQSVSVGYYEARTLEFLTNETNALLEWMRLPGDVVFIVGGVLPLLYLCYLGVRQTVPRIVMEEPEDILFTEITEPEATGPRER